MEKHFIKSKIRLRETHQTRKSDKKFNWRHARDWRGSALEGDIWESLILSNGAGVRMNRTNSFLDNELGGSVPWGKIFGGFGLIFGKKGYLENGMNFGNFVDLSSLFPGNSRRCPKIYRQKPGYGSSTESQAVLNPQRNLRRWTDKKRLRSRKRIIGIAFFFDMQVGETRNLPNIIASIRHVRDLVANQIC